MVMKTLKLEKIADIQVGYQARERVMNDIHGSHKLIQGKDFDDEGVLQLDSLISFSPERKPGIYEVQKGDILLQSRGMKHSVYYIDKDINNTLAAGSFYIIRVKSEEVLPAYLYWYLNQQAAQSFLDAHSGGATISFIPKKSILELEIRVPQMKKQKNIKEIMKLWKKEQKLRNDLYILRSQLLTSVCLKSIEK